MPEGDLLGGYTPRAGGSGSGIPQATFFRGNRLEKRIIGIPNQEIPMRYCDVCGKPAASRKHAFYGVYFERRCVDCRREGKGRLTPESRFWAKAIKREGCWGWAGSFSSDGYAVIGVGTSRNVHASRFSWELHNGPIPAGLYVCHKCDNPECTNPEHLFLGSPADNMADMKQKGRATRGEKSGRALLTESAVIEILTGPETHKEKAARFGVSVDTVQAIRSRKIWKHIQCP